MLLLLFSICSLIRSQVRSFVYSSRFVVLFITFLRYASCCCCCLLYSLLLVCRVNKSKQVAFCYYYYYLFFFLLLLSFIRLGVRISTCVQLYLVSYYYSLSQLPDLRIYRNFDNFKGLKGHIGDLH